MVADSTFSSNSAFEGGGIEDYYGTLTVSNSTFCGNSAFGSGGFFGSAYSDGGSGGGIANFEGTMTLTNSTFANNSASHLGGAIYFYSSYGQSAFTNVTIANNFASGGGGGMYVLSVPGTFFPLVNNSIVVNNYFGPSNSPYNIAGSVDPASADNLIGPGARVGLNGGVLTGFGGLQNGVNGNQVGVTDPGLAPLGNYGGPTQTIALLPGSAAVGAGSVALAVDANSNPLATDQRGPGFPRTLNGTVDIGAFEALDPVYDLQTAISAEVQANPTAPTLTIGIPDDSHAQDAVNAIDKLDKQNTPPITLVLNLAPGNYSGETVSAPSDVTLIINGSVSSQLPTTVDPDTPAFMVQSGHVAVNNVTFTESGAAPTIQVTGGSLTLRNDVVQSSTGFAEPAIAVSGGSTVDLGTAASPGGNTIVVNGGGQALASTGLNFVTAVGDTFQASGAATFPVATVAVASSTNPSLLNQPVTFTATASAANAGAAVPTGTVTFLDTSTGATLGVASLSGGQAQLTTAALPVNAQTIAAVYSGDANYIISTATLVQAVQYHFSGFLAPLSASLAIALGRTVPIKFQLTDYNGNFISSLSAVASLQVLNAQGVNVLTNAGSTALRYDPMANQFVANWQTKGLPAGTYTVQLKLADGTTQTKTLQLTTSGGSSGLQTDAAGGTAASGPGGLLGGDVDLYVDNSSGDLTPDELARIQDAVSAVDAITEPYGVAVTEVSDPSQADVMLNMDTTSAVGGYADGVLGCTTDAGQITIISGWDFYAGSDAAQVGAGEYDFQTVVTHELGHALGLGHSADGTSVMYATLDTGSAKRSLTTADLNVPDADTAGACGLHAAIALATPGPAALAGAETVSAGSGDQSAGPAGSPKAPASMGPASRLGVIPLGGPAEGAATMSRPSVRVILVGLSTGPVAAAAAGSHAVPASAPARPLPLLMGLGGGSGMAGAEPDVPAVDPGRRAAARDAFFETQPQWDGEPLHARAADSPGMAAALGDLAGALGLGDAKDAGEVAGPAVRSLAAGGPVLFALLGATWGARVEDPEARRQRGRRQG